MRRDVFSWFVAFLLAAGGCSGEAGSRKTNNENNLNNENDRCTCRDTDGDGICDFDEGAAELLDTDRDGTPDFQDLDSDGDGILDAVEAGDDTTCTPPFDTDGDGIPDVQDSDSDGNGIFDAVEGTGDTDGDGVADFMDMDNDGDYLPDAFEVGGCDTWETSQIPCDADGDGTPDFQDIDSDADGIGDRWETSADADGDGMPNFRDSDSDGDGILDALEGGTGGDPWAEPADSDADGFYDFADVDSDNDGLPDGTEDSNHNGIQDPGETDSRSGDTDGDGVSDLIETAAGTDPLSPADSPRTRGDFVFLVPYQEAPDPPEDVLNFSTAFQMLDLLFVIDVSGSMSAEINAVRDGLAAMLDDLICLPGQNPSADHCIPDVQTGIILFGQSGTPYTLVKTIDDNNLPADPGADADCTYNRLPTTASGGSEQTVRSQSLGFTGTCAADPGRIGQGCFRPRALHLVLLVTDEDLQEDTDYANRQNHWDIIYGGGGRTIVDYGAGGATEIDRLITDMLAASSGGVALVPVISPLAYSSIPVCQTLSPNPFYLSGSDYRALVRGDDANAGPALSCAVQAVGAYMPQDVEARIFNDPANADALGNPVDAPAAFIDYIEVFMVDQDTQCPAGYNTIDSNSDGHADKFVQILPGNPVCWRIHVKENQVVVPAETPQMFKATVEVYGTGDALLDSRDVYFLVPPEFSGPGGPA